MKALQNIIVLVTSLFLWAPVFAQVPSDAEIFNRYCKEGKGKYIYRLVPLMNEANEKQLGPSGEELTYQRPRIECQYGPTPRYVFETKNGLFIKVDNNSLILKEDPNTKEKTVKIFDEQGVESDFFSSPKWLAYINQKAIEDSKCPVETAKTEFIGGKYVFTCGNLSHVINVPKEAKEEYVMGLESYLQDKTSYKDILDAKSIFPNDEKVIPVVQDNANDHVGDKTIITNDKVINLPDQNNLTSYKFHPKTIKPYEFKVSEFTYAGNPNFQKKSPFPDYAAKFKESLPELSYLDFGSDEADVLSKYRLPESVFKWETKLETPYNLGNNAKPFKSLTPGLPGTEESYGSDFGFNGSSSKFLFELPPNNYFGTTGGSFGSLNSYTPPGKTRFPGSNTFSQGVVTEDATLLKDKENPVKTDDNAPVDEVIENKVTEDPNCEEELSKALAALLAQEEGQNIIGLQYELTVLKVASIVVEGKNKTLEGMIRQQSKAIADADKTKILEQMGALYKKHGLPEDQEKIYEHLKTKSASANYYVGDKRFFNEESSAFMMAYQHLNPESGINGIKETDISVLWFMDKVSEKAKGRWGKFSEGHNLTNLSTRVAYYTGGITSDRALSTEKLNEMIKVQKAQIDKELLALIEGFKTKNKGCYDKLFSEGENDCNLGVVEESLSKLLAINAKIASTDQISLDNYLKGGLNQTRFKLSRYVKPKVESAK